MKIFFVNIVFIFFSTFLYIKLLKFYKERHYKWYRYCKKNTKLKLYFIAISEITIGDIYWLIGDKKIFLRLYNTTTTQANQIMLKK